MYDLELLETINSSDINDVYRLEYIQ